MSWGEPDPKADAAVARGLAKKLAEMERADAHERRVEAAKKRHAKALPTGARISKADRKKLRARIALATASVDAENRVNQEVRQRLNIVRATPGLMAGARSKAVLSRLTNGQLAAQRRQAIDRLEARR